MPPIIIISETEEPGAFDRASSCIVLTLDSGQIAEWQSLAAECKAKYSSFSELRLHWYDMELYEDLSVESTFLTALESIADAERESDAPRVTQAQVDELRAFYEENNYFVWPANVPFDALDINNMAALVNGEEQAKEGDLDCIGHDLDEIALIGDDEFYAVCYTGDQLVQSKPVSYEDVLQAVA
ncbi:MAG: hypothetical protein JSS66_05855 [Armatimonadetes bacterium]|nr:hypothetical protein [Armatimonadota bacterium]